MSAFTKGFAVLVLFGVLLIAACSTYGTNGYANKTSAPTAHVVEIKDFVFSPATLAVKPGDTITWTNLDIVPHTATANDKSWTSDELKTGESYTLTVAADTSADYFCVYHPSMLATLDVASK